MSGWRSLLLSTVPTLWARRRAVIELGGGRLPHRSPLGGGRVAYEGAQQPQALELGSFSPHPHDLTASSASLWLSDRPAGASSRDHWPPNASSASVSIPRPQPQPQPPPSCMFWGPVGDSSDDRDVYVFCSFFRCDRYAVNRCVTARGG